MTDPASIPSTPELLKALGTALGLGLLVGLQREWTRDRIAGIRTFALVSLFGALRGLLALAFGNGWVLAAGVLVNVALNGHEPLHPVRARIAARRARNAAHAAARG